MRIMDGPYSQKDARHMAAFQKEFEREVEADGFTREAKCLVIQGPTMDKDGMIAVASLIRGQYMAYPATPHEILRRLDSKYIPRSDEEVDKAFESAETLWVFDLFSEEVIGSLSDMDRGTLAWYFKDAVNEGICLVFPTTEPEPDLNILGETFGEFIEQNFEVIDVPATTKKKRK